jgi:hypothetical protein
MVTQIGFRATVSEFAKSEIYCTAALAKRGDLAKLYAALIFA